MKFLTLISVVSVTMAFGACGTSGESSSESTKTVAASATKTKIRAPAKNEPTVVIPERPPPKQLVVRDLKEGGGATAEAGDKLTVEYVGYDYRSGYQFDTHAHRWGKGEPAVFELGAEEVILGWDQGVEGMKVGGRRELIIPPNLAYGNVAPPPEVGPNETVIFVVELLGIG